MHFYHSSERINKRLVLFVVRILAMPWHRDLHADFRLHAQGNFYWFLAKNPGIFNIKKCRT
jgi:hypothetical protein